MNDEKPFSDERIQMMDKNLSNQKKFCNVKNFEGAIDHSFDLDDYVKFYSAGCYHQHREELDRFGFSKSPLKSCLKWNLKSGKLSVEERVQVLKLLEDPNNELPPQFRFKNFVKEYIHFADRNDIKHFYYLNDEFD